MLSVGVLRSGAVAIIGVGVYGDTGASTVPLIISTFEEQ